MGLIEAFLDALFPNKCVGCDRIIPKGDSLCDFCFETMPTTAADNRCRVCGLKKKECQCRFHIFHFSSVTAPFYNTELARRVMYAFKFRRHIEFADFFAERMTLSVKTDFYGVDFNAVVYVPMTLKNELKRGYNQSRELAVRIANMLDAPLVENALGCNNKRFTQHKTYIKKRFKNVKGIYYPNLSLKGRTVLLVDDIKTTGATLDECTKALFKAGANEVYCVTGLISKKKAG